MQLGLCLIGIAFLTLKNFIYLLLDEIYDCVQGLQIYNVQGIRGVFKFTATQKNKEYQEKLPIVVLLIIMYVYFSAC